MAELILIRGLPGSGKSTLAKKNFPDHANFEADMYFIDESGEYVFNGGKIKAAHEWCQASTKKALSEGKDVVVTNTFTQLWEMESYFSMGADKVRVLRATGNYGNIHGVPEEAVERMRQRFESCDGEELLSSE